MNESLLYFFIVTNFKYPIYTKISVFQLKLKIKSASRCIPNKGRPKEPSVKTSFLLHSPSLSAEIWRHCVLSGGTQRHALPRHQSDENENKNFNKYLIPEWGSNPQPVDFAVTLNASALRLASTKMKIKLKKKENCFVLIKM